MPQQGAGEDAGVVVGVVEVVTERSAAEVEEIPHQPQLQKPEIPPVGVHYRLGCLDDEKKAGTFYGELDHAELNKGQQLAASCLQVFQVCFPFWL